MLYTRYQRFLSLLRGALDVSVNSHVESLLIWINLLPSSSTFLTTSSPKKKNQNSIVSLSFRSTKLYYHFFRRICNLQYSRLFTYTHRKKKLVEIRGKSRDTNAITTYPPVHQHHRPSPFHPNDSKFAIKAGREGTRILLSFKPFLPSFLPSFLPIVANPLNAVFKAVIARIARYSRPN